MARKKKSEDELIRDVMRKMGSKGGKKRVQKLTPEQLKKQMEQVRKARSREKKTKAPPEDS